MHGCQNLQATSAIVRSYCIKSFSGYNSPAKRENAPENSNYYQGPSTKGKFVTLS